MPTKNPMQNGADCSIFPTSILEIGRKKDVKKKEKDFYLEKANKCKKDVDEGKPAKRRKTSEDKKSKGKKLSILCVIEPYLPGSTPDKQLNTHVRHVCLFTL